MATRKALGEHAERKLPGAVNAGQPAGLPIDAVGERRRFGCRLSYRPRRSDGKLRGRLHRRSLAVGARQLVMGTLSAPKQGDTLRCTRNC
jgi:hypothetical protein